MSVYLDETIQSYIAYLKEVKKAPYQTFRAYHVDLLQFLKYFLKNEKNEIPSKDEMEEYVSYIKGKYNYSTYRRKITTLRNFITYLIESGINVPDPLISISLPMPDIDFQIESKYEDLLNIINSLTENTFLEIRDKLIFSLIAKSGLTIKQLLSLRIKDINTASNQIIISKNQMTFIDNDTTVLLQKYFSELQKKSPISLDNYLLINKLNIPLSTRTINLIVDKISSKAGSTSRLSPTILRRLFAKSLNEKNINKATKELILGKKCRLAG